MKNKFVIWWGRSSLILILFGIIMTGIFIAIKGQEYAPGHYTASFSDIFPWAIFLFGGIISCVVFVIYGYFSKDSIQQQEPTKIITSMNGKYKAEIYKKKENSYYVKYYEKWNSSGYGWSLKGTSIYDSLEKAIIKSEDKFERCQ
ncbi:hypothetical protein ACJUAE_002836 [Listeria monocytogenes]